MEIPSSGSQSGSSSGSMEPEGSRKEEEEEKKYLKALEHVAFIRTLTPLDLLYFGPNGAVAKMKNSILRTEIAVKIEPFRDDSVIDIWTDMKHNNILPLIETIPIDTLKYKGRKQQWTAYLMPYCPTTLAKQSFSKEIRQSREAFKTCTDWIRQIIQGMSYMHQRGIFHLDIKEDNVLLNEYGHAVLADFTFVTTKSSIDKHYIGCPIPYKPPEAIASTDVKLLSEGVDLWALAILVVNVLTMGKTYNFIPQLEQNMHEGWLKHLRPFLLNLKQSYNSFVDLLCSSYPRHKFIEYETKMAWNFVKNLIIEEPSDRCGAEVLLKHDFVSYSNTGDFIKNISIQYLGACESCATLISLPSWEISSDIYRFSDCLCEEEDIMIKKMMTEKALQGLEYY